MRYISIVTEAGRMHLSAAQEQAHIAAEVAKGIEIGGQTVALNTNAWVTLQGMQLLCVLIAGAAGAIVPLLHIRLAQRTKRGFAGGGIACALAAYLLIFTMSVSSVMTILREWKSEYQVYTAEEVALTEQIKAASEPDAVILANSYHWNLITPLTGRNIVTGTGTFLYYHGIDVSERTEHVRQMYETPAQCEDLFSTYHVGYVLISNAERGNYQIDEAYFRSHGTVVAENEAGLLYRLNQD